MNIIIGQNESLPNIKGSLINSGDEGVVGNANSITPSGCFSVSNSYKNYCQWSGKSTLTDKVYFNASYFSSAYKDDAKVTTLNFTYKIWNRKF